MKNILVFVLCMVGLAAFGQPPIQRQAFTTNILPATIDTSASTLHNTLIDSTVTGNGNGLTNINLADGANGNEWGSASSMNTAPGTGPTVWAMGSAAGFASAGDNALIYINQSTNFLNNGGFGSAVIGTGSSGATLIARTQGPTFSYISTNESETFINTCGEIVMNYSASLLRFFAIVSPGGGTIGADSGNYAGLIVDWEHHMFRVPLIPQGNTNGGCRQPDDIIYKFTPTSPPGVAPPFPSGYKDANGTMFTSLSNNAAGTALFLSGNTVAPAASGTLTKFSSDAGDATIPYTAVVQDRIYIGDTFLADQSTGNIAAYARVSTTNGHFSSFTAHPNAGGSIVDPLTTFSNIDYGMGNADGMAVVVNRGQEQMCVGVAANTGMSMTRGNNFANIVTTDFGNAEVVDAVNTGNSLVTFHGSLGTSNNTYTANTTLGVLDSTAMMNGSGVISATLPDSTSHAKGRFYQVKNISTTNCITSTILTFTVSGITITPTPGAVYTHNGFSYTVVVTSISAGAGTVSVDPGGAPLASGTLTKSSGTGDATISFSAATTLQTIDGKVSFTNAPQQCITAQSDGTVWRIIQNYGGAPTNFYAITATGWTNSDNWTHELHIKGTAVTYTNFDGAGQAYETNTTLINTDQTILLQPAGHCNAASGLSGTVHAIIR
jgi:hypothetical protein